MSTELENIDKLQFTQFNSGNGNISVQITGEDGFIQLNNNDCYQTILLLTDFLKENASRKANKIKERIRQDEALEKTLLKDAVECERFISDLKILEIPLKLLEY